LIGLAGAYQAFAVDGATSAAKVKRNPADHATVAISIPLQGANAKAIIGALQNSSNINPNTTPVSVQPQQGTDLTEYTLTNVTISCQQQGKSSNCSIDVPASP
jgi:hypothetical protein